MSSARCLAVLGLALFGCACPLRRPPPGPKAGPPPPGAGEIVLDQGFVVLQLHVPAAPAGPKPTVISFLADQEPLLAAGVMVATYRLDWKLVEPFRPPEPPPPPGGHPVGQWLLAAPSPKTVGQGFFGVITTNAESAIPKIVDYLATRPDVDAARIGVVGNSTYGFTTLQAVAADPRLTAAAAIVASGDYRCFLNLSNLAMAGTPLDLDPVYARWLDEHDPVRHPERLVHAALLMVNGKDDPAVPLACAERTARVLGDAYRRAGVPERFRFELAGGGHVIEEEARRGTLAWFRRWLIHPGG